MNNNQKHVFIFVLSILIFIILVLYVYSSDHRTQPTRKHKQKLLQLNLEVNEIQKLEKDDKSWFYDNINTCIGPVTDTDCNEYDNICSKNVEHECQLLKEAIHNRGIHPQCPLLY
jgi:S-methylmethionine-dependent homocysteine/selenocysteine methylase